MTNNRKQQLAAEIQALEAEGRRLAAIAMEWEPGSTLHSREVANQHVAVTTKRRELAAIIRREAGLTERRA